MFSENRAASEIVWKNMVEPDDDVTQQYHFHAG
jgi:hypothetical protein